MTVASFQPWVARFLALVQALTSEAQLTGCRSVILDAENGKIMISAVPSAHQPMIVIVVTKQQVLLGVSIHGMNKLPLIA